MITKEMRIASETIGLNLVHVKPLEEILIEEREDFPGDEITEEMKMAKETIGLDIVVIEPNLDKDYVLYLDEDKYGYPRKNTRQQNKN